MKHYFLRSAALIALVAGGMQFSHASTPKVTVDRHGRMINSETRAEVRYYGTNYTLPFAHGFRAANALGIDIRTAIDRDVYHMSRMGLNAFRMHLWDAELADSVGNLVDNEHLALLDYLIAQLEKRGIDIILTAQTNFGNGYPEKNIDTGAFTYDFEKCRIHEDPKAIAAQEKYISALSKHKNPYTGKTYADDPSIISMEINNEPCHMSSSRQVKDYINTMVKALRRSGWEKPILYNVSHNGDVVDGYYDADIQGTTYQWYPIGLVAGRERKGNFLPYVADYNIPFSDCKRFDRMAKVVYEFDPADMLESYLFPAVARTFARNGFQWATQFAYDPIDLARFNTEYQTHYLNLAYTPQKALGMRIAAHAMANTPYEQNAKPVNYPVDSIFNDITLSYTNNLALLNSTNEYIHTNSTDKMPVSPDSLLSIAGYGSSPLVEYSGRGAYFIDKIPGTDVWRLEVLPDVFYTSDPFGKPSLRREFAHIINATHPMSLKLPNLGESFAAQKISPERGQIILAKEGTITVNPGVYFVGKDEAQIDRIATDNRLGAIRIDEYVMPPVKQLPVAVNHTPVKYLAAGDSLVIRAEAIAPTMPDSLIVYPDDVSFWREHNRLYSLHKTAPYTYEATIPAIDIAGRDKFRYRIVMPDIAQVDSTHLATSADITFPGALSGNPLDWDIPEGGDYYSVKILDKTDPIVLFDASEGFDGMELSTIPDTWGRARTKIQDRLPVAPDELQVNLNAGSDSIALVLTKFVKPTLAPLAANLNDKNLMVRFGENASVDSIKVSVINSDGVTFSTSVSPAAGETVSINPSEMTLTPTLLVPAPYPTFLGREYTPTGYAREPRLTEIEKIQIVVPAGPSESTRNFSIVGIWIQ